MRTKVKLTLTLTLTLTPLSTLMLTLTMTMTHSDEVTNGSQKPGPTDVSAGVMTPHTKNRLSVNALLNKQGGLLVLCIIRCDKINQNSKR